MKQRFSLILAGMLLAAVGAAGTLHGLRAAAAQILYHQAKFGSARDNPRRILRRCEAAHRLYPFNYRFCGWAAEEAYYHPSPVPAAAAHWCDAGLRLNPYVRDLQVLKTRLLAERSLPRAIEHWEAYVDRNFWDPYHHALLAELHAHAGHFSEALESLKWVKGSPYFRETRRIVDEAWDRETAPPDLRSPPAADPAAAPGHENSIR